MFNNIVKIKTLYKRLITLLYFANITLNVDNDLKTVEL